MRTMFFSIGIAMAFVLTSNIASADEDARITDADCGVSQSCDVPAPPAEECDGDTIQLQRACAYSLQMQKALERVRRERVAQCIKARANAEMRCRIVKGVCCFTKEHACDRCDEALVAEHDACEGAAAQLTL